MMIRAIKTEADYDAALVRIEELFESKPGSPDFDELEVWATLVGAYEDENYPVPPPSPIEAIEFMMDQKGLKQKDLVPFIGSKSKVSEVLNGKRSLSLKMIRALHEHLNIPADTLLQEPGKELSKDLAGMEWAKFPVAEIVRRGWVQPIKDAKDKAEEIVRELMIRAGTPDKLPCACCRNGLARVPDNIDMYGVQAWLLGVLIKAQDMETNGDYNANMGPDFLKRLSHLSMYGDGPLKAVEYLGSKGIKLVIEPHFPRTKLDGAAISHQGVPIVALTLRHDRVDNFWFTLLHECAHVIKHLSPESDLILDDLDTQATDDREHEANVLARDSIIPPDMWEQHEVHTTKKPTTDQVMDLARKMEVHPALIAGKVRYERGNYKLLSKLVGHGDVRRLFKN